MSARTSLRSLAGAVEAVRRLDVSPVELTEALMARLESEGDPLNCFVTLDGERALEQARVAERAAARRRPLGLLHGVPISVKDNIATAGLRTTAGSPLLADWVPAEDAAAVARLREAGAIVFAKTQLYEFAFGEAHASFGFTRNPWNAERTCAGSSSGSAAAVAARLGYGSVGTDTGGSIRVPASFCGVVGLKPTFDLVDRRGVVPVSHSLDHVGPIARTVEDAGLLLAAMTGGHRPGELGGIEGVRVGVLRLPPDEPVAPDVASALAAAASALAREGATVGELDGPDRLAARTALWAIASVEAAEWHRRRLRTRADDYHPLVRRRLERGEFVSGVDYVRAQRVRAKLVGELSAAADGYDVLLLPTCGTTAYPRGTRTVTCGDHEEEASSFVTRWTPLFSLAGWPAVSVPWSLDREGLPTSIQVCARAYADALALRVAAACERLAGFPACVPAG